MSTSCFSLERSQMTCEGLTFLKKCQIVPFAGQNIAFSFGHWWHETELTFPLTWVPLFPVFCDEGNFGCNRRWIMIFVRWVTNPDLLCSCCFVNITFAHIVASEEAWKDFILKCSKLLKLDPRSYYHKTKMLSLWCKWQLQWSVRFISRGHHLQFCMYNFYGKFDMDS